jgi:capsular polysaccharide biosynthesis protein
MPEAVLMSGEWLLKVNDRVLYDFNVDQPRPPHSAYVAGVGPSHAQVFLEQPLGAIGRSMLLGGSRNYAHWMLDVVPRLSFIAEADRAMSAGVGAASAPCPIIINRDRASFQDQTLELLGIGRERLVELDYPATYVLQDCLIPCTGSGIGTNPLTMQQDAMRWVRDALWKKLGLRPRRIDAPKDGRRLFVSRLAEGADRMRLMNHADIIERARRLGFEVVNPAGLSVADQVRIFAEASVVTGPHGAGFANMVFAPPGAALLELMGPRVNLDYGMNKFFARLCALCGHKYARVVGEQVDPHAMEERHVSTERYVVPADAFANGVAALSSSSRS